MLQGHGGHPLLQARIETRQRARLKGTTFFFMCILNYVYLLTDMSSLLLLTEKLDVSEKFLI